MEYKILRPNYISLYDNDKHGKLIIVEAFDEKDDFLADFFSLDLRGDFRNLLLQINFSNYRNRINAIIWFGSIYEVTFGGDKIKLKHKYFDDVRDYDLRYLKESLKEWQDVYMRNLYFVNENNKRVYTYGLFHMFQYETMNIEDDVEKKVKIMIYCINKTSNVYGISKLILLKMIRKEFLQIGRDDIFSRLDYSILFQDNNYVVEDEIVNILIQTFKTIEDNKTIENFAF